jgi:phage replication-related protein YjqB (UPF0714/DUF867 family)
MVDKYKNFKELSDAENEGVDFRITLRRTKSNTIVVAPHGGSIERGTSEIAKAIAGKNYSFYAFEGSKPSGNRDLHITSTNFDEPHCLELVQSVSRVITIHGERGRQAIVYLGGRDKEMLVRLRSVLRSRGFDVHDHKNLQGRDALNICNRGISQVGVQIEITAGLRHRLFKSLSRYGRRHTTRYFDEFIDAIKVALR